MTTTALPPSAHVDDVHVMSIIGGDGKEWFFYFGIIDLDATYSDRYQRPLNERWLRKQEANFRPELLGALTVSARERRSKQYSLIDGQHRRELCKRMGVKKMLAVIYIDLTVAQEAELFSSLQRERRGITPWQRFQADLVSQKPEQKAVNAIVNSVGLELTETRDDAGYIKCVVALERIYQDDPALLRIVLELVQATWPGIPGARSERLIRGLWRFVKDETDLSHDRFVDRLSDKTPSYLVQKAQQLRDGNESGGTLPGFMAEAISNAYRRRKAR